MKEITVLAFGKVSEIVGKSRFVINNVSSTDELKEQLEAEYPLLKNIRYAVAVNMQMTADCTPIEAGAAVALLPPFSGG